MADPRNPGNNPRNTPDSPTVGSDTNPNPQNRPGPHVPTDLPDGGHRLTRPEEANTPEHKGDPLPHLPPEGGRPRHALPDTRVNNLGGPLSDTQRQNEREAGRGVDERGRPLPVARRAADVSDGEVSSCRQSYWNKAGKRIARTDDQIKEAIARVGDRGNAADTESAVFNELLG